MGNQYVFVTHWRVKGTIEEVSAILDDPLQLSRWWPSVYLQVSELAPGDPRTHVGRVVDLHTKGFLPYTLRWNFTVTGSNPPTGFEIAAHGDFEGTGVWTLRQDGEYADITYEWRIAAEKPLLRYGSFALRPFFAANHRWAMARGLESLELELRRRRGEAAVPAPPGASFS